jgi:hypothetical protein
MPRRLTAGALVACAGGMLAGTAVAERGTVAAKRTAASGPFYGVLLGKNAISATGRRGAGDKNGRGGATAVIDGNQLCYGLAVKNIDTPAAVHIHRSGPDTNGGVVVGLKRPEEGDPAASSGCVPISATLASGLRRNPSRYYWNVHTERYPGGAIRGQVTAKSR